MRGGVSLIYSPFWIASKLNWHSSTVRSVCEGAYANRFAQCLRSHWAHTRWGASHADASVDAGRAEQSRVESKESRTEPSRWRVLVSINCEGVAYTTFNTMYQYIYNMYITLSLSRCVCVSVWFTNAHGFLVPRCRHLAQPLLLLFFVYLREAVFLVCFDRCFSLTYIQTHAM